MVVDGDEAQHHIIVLTKNQIAKNFGIKTGTALVESRRLCPGLVVLPPNYPLYLDYSRRVRAIYNDYTDQQEPFGLDESFLDVTHSTWFGSGEQIAEEIRQRVKAEVGISVSIGVSYNKIFAKLGSDVKKPDAVTAISKVDFKEKVWPLPASDLLYVGPATTKKLNNRMIRTIGDIAKCEPKELKRFLGVIGEMLWTFANGYDNTPVMKTGEENVIKSIGNSSTFPRDLINNEDVRMAFWVLAESVAARLREHGFICETVQISVRDNKLFRFERQKKLERPTNLASELVQAAMELFTQNYTWSQPIRSIGIRGTDLMSENTHWQLSVFGNEDQRKKREILERTMDQLRKRYGYFSLHRGILLQDRGITSLDAKAENIIHPVSYNYSK